MSRTASPGLHGELVVGPTKRRRVRLGPLAAPLVPIVIGAMRAKGAHERLFPGPRGVYINSKNLSRALNWAEVRDTVETFPPGEEPLHSHDLRHTGAVVLLLAGVSLPDVQAILGHASLAVTQLCSDRRRDVAKRGTAALSAFRASANLGQSGRGRWLVLI